MVDSINTLRPNSRRITAGDVFEAGATAAVLGAGFESGLGLYKMRAPLRSDKFESRVVKEIEDLKEQRASLKESKFTDDLKIKMERYYDRKIDEAAQLLQESKAQKNARALGDDFVKTGLKDVAKKAGVTGGLAALGAMFIMTIAKATQSFFGKR